MFNRDTTAAFIAHVEDDTGQKAADVGVTLQRSTTEQSWQVAEINLDLLLADYAKRVAGGDVHYTPLIKNPQGGDTLILYFGFDEDSLTARTKRQLDIVAGLLKIDPEKKLTLSGHTDSLGTDQYNHGLSARRATTVQQYLLQSKVPPTQIVAMAEGEAKRAAQIPPRPAKTTQAVAGPIDAPRSTSIFRLCCWSVPAGSPGSKLTPDESIDYAFLPPEWSTMDLPLMRRREIFCEFGGSGRGVSMTLNEGRL